jgi:RHS repeat-associated protein
VVKNVYDHDAFGTAFAPGTSVTVEQRYTYTGRERSGVGGVPMYYRYRWYESQLGRFGQRDPTARFWPRNGNPYHFPRNNPVRDTDPYGQFSVLEVALVVAAVVLLYYAIQPLVEDAKEAAQEDNDLPDGADGEVMRVAREYDALPDLDDCQTCEKKNRLKEELRKLYDVSGKMIDRAGDCPNLPSATSDALAGAPNAGTAVACYAIKKKLGQLKKQLERSKKDFENTTEDDDCESLERNE